MGVYRKRSAALAYKEELQQRAGNRVCGSSGEDRLRRVKKEARRRELAKGPPKGEGQGGNELAR